MNIIKTIKDMVGGVKVLRHTGYLYIYTTQFRYYLRRLGFENKKVAGEDEYLRKWRQLACVVEPYSYRLFSHYVCPSANIVPENIGHAVIEELLNPLPMRKAYMDKNLFVRIIGKENMPRTIVCRINGSQLLDEDYNMAERPLSYYVKDAMALILKPTVDSASGRGVMKFERHGDDFYNITDHTLLTKDYLMGYNSNLILQEAIEQHEFMNRLCPTSVNTIRLCLYRSPRTEQSEVTSGVIRIGKTGSVVDNAHAGGMVVGVDVKTGRLGHYVVDQYGHMADRWNDLDFANEQLAVPHWEEVIRFAKYVGSRCYPHRLLGLDVALTANGTPLLIEYNIKCFGFWVMMFAGQEVFGEYTNEIIDYCKQYRKRKA